MDTTSITRKSAELTKRLVAQQLANAFQEELTRLHFRYAEIELQAAGGERGSLFHRLVFRRATAVELPKVLSEGESCALPIAAFFAELSTASDKSAIVFDDPVSSLDHDWRERVACRLADEAKSRQVIVFTHDIVFLLGLVKSAENAGAPYHHQYLRREITGAGVCSCELPWVAMKVKDRIGVLKNMCQAAEKLSRTDTGSYEREATHIYGLLREAW